MDFGLKDKTAVVLASTTGLGLAVAEALLAEGAHVAISGRDRRRLDTTLKRLQTQYGDAVAGTRLDVTDTEALQAYLQEVDQRRGGVDILVINAGGPPTGLASEVTLEDLDRGFALTLRSAVAAATAVLPRMRERQWGRIVGMTSSSARQPIDNLTMSNTMRAGLTGYLKTLSREVARDGVLVNSICTGMFMTDRLVELFEIRAGKAGTSVAEEQRKMEQEIPLGRIGDPAEFGAMVAFMVSERASFLNGVALPYDGGFTRHLL